MKLNSKWPPALKFIGENHFVKSVIIHNNNKTVYFPDIKKEKRRYFDKIIVRLKENDPGSHLLLYTHSEYIYLYKKNQTIYICECSNDISVSQVKMEFNTFIEDTDMQSKFPKFLLSFFDR